MKKKVIIAGHSLNDINGLSNVAGMLIVSYLNKGFEVAYLNISSKPTDKKGLQFHGITKNITVINANVYDNKCKSVFDDYLKDNPTELVISIHDLWLLDHITYSAFRSSFCWIAYQTFETNRYPDSVLAPTAVFPFPDKYKSLKAIVNSCDLVVPCSVTGEQALTNFGIKDSEFVYLGIDIPNKNVIDSYKSLTKKEVFNIDISEDSKIFMMVGVNNQRKKIDRTVLAFANFLKSIDEEEQNKHFLYLHSNLKRSFNGADIFEVLKELGISNNVIIEMRNLPKEILYRRYAKCDCFISLYGAEGFGIPFVEALLFDKPVIYTDYSAPAEYCTNFGKAVEVQTYIYAPNFAIQLAIADIHDAVFKMREVMLSEIDEERTDSYEFVKENFNWKTNFEKLYYIINEAFDEWDNNQNKLKILIKRII